MMQHSPKSVELSKEIADFRVSLRALEREISRSLEAQTECCGVTLAQCHVLLEIQDRGTVTAGELAEALVLDKSTLSRSLSALEALGWLMRTEDRDNRRRAPIELTAEGKKKVVSIDSQCNEIYGRLLGAMDEEKRKTLTEGAAILARALAALREGKFPCCGFGRKNNEH